MRIAATIAADTHQLVGLGRAPRVALVEVADGRVTGQTVVDTHWDQLHGQHGHDHSHDQHGGAHGPGNLHPGEGSHHARIVRFLRENQVEAVLAAHAGPPMVNTIAKLGLPFFTGQGDAVELAQEAARHLAGSGQTGTDGAS